MKTKLINSAKIKMTGMGNQIFSDIFEVTGKGATTLASTLMPLDSYVLATVEMESCIIAVAIRTYAVSHQMSPQTCKLFAYKGCVVLPAGNCFFNIPLHHFISTVASE